ncbi:hypothetical protein FXO38_11485 [Capsicum annuum]|nr:hypothetical protein FXO37_25667 [Capsicum annuum]KAF3661772.1 hypothetical protein FXO38_11485 [Capsicum annuum]
MSSSKIIKMEEPEKQLNLEGETTMELEKKLNLEGETAMEPEKKLNLEGHTTMEKRRRVHGDYHRSEEYNRQVKESNVHGDYHGSYYDSDPIFEEYHRQVKESDGFDVDVEVTEMSKRCFENWPVSITPSGVSFIHPLQGIENNPKIIDMSQWAIHKYNLAKESLSDEISPDSKVGKQ